MLFLLSPAKKLDYDTPLHVQKYTQPLFVKEAAGLVDILREKSAAEMADLMNLSQTLSALNVTRYIEWEPTFSLENSRQAILAFNGDVYEGLQARTLDARQLDWAQEHVAILSGLYGVLRPLDLMQPYRLEMGTRLANPAGKTLYAYWRSAITPYLNERLAQEKDPTVIHLASEEYFKSVDVKALKARIVQCVFQEYKNGTYKVISFNAKRARGLMTRFAIETQAQTPKDLLSFNLEGYRYDTDASSEDTLVFRRRRET